MYEVSEMPSPLVHVFSKHLLVTYDALVNVISSQADGHLPVKFNKISSDSMSLLRVGTKREGSVLSNRVRH